MLAFHQHHKFDCHVDNIIEKMKSASHAIVRLKQFGVDPFAPALFYRTKVLSVLSYAVPLWYPHVTDKYKEKVSHYRVSFSLKSPKKMQKQCRIPVLVMIIDVEIATIIFWYGLYRVISCDIWWLLLGDIMGLTVTNRQLL